MNSSAVLASVAVALVAGCHKDAPAPGDCATVVGSGLERAMQQGLREHAGSASSARIAGATAELKATLAPINDAMIRVCTDDRWSADALACMAAATTGSAFDACQAKLTPAQRQHADEVVAAAKAKATPAASPTCQRYADLEIQCGNAEPGARVTILQFCEAARGGAGDATHQLIARESTCAGSAADCEAYRECLDLLKGEAAPD